MTDTLYHNPLVQSYTTNSPDPYYAAYADVSNPSCRFPLDRKSVRSIVLDDAETYVFTPADLKSHDGSVIIATVVGAARIKVTGVDSDLSTPTVGYLPTYGTALLPGYVLLSTFNVSAFEILGQADDTTVELFYGAQEDIVATNIGLVTQASRLYSASLSLVTATPTNVTNSPATSITLDEGSYEIRACANFETSGAVVTRFNVAVSTASAVEPGNDRIGVPGSTGDIKLTFQAGSALSFTEFPVTVPTYVLVVPANTTATLYLVATATFASGTCVVNGWIEARKVL